MVDTKLETQIVSCFISDFGVDTIPLLKHKGVTSEMFQSAQWRKVYESALKCKLQNRSVDEINLIKFDSAIELHWFNELDHMDSPTWMLDGYANNLIDAYKKRKIESIILRAKLLVEEVEDIDEIPTFLKKELDAVAQIGEVSTMEHVSDISERVNEKIKKAIAGDPVECYTCQYDEINKRIKGFFRQKLYFIGGLPGTGKTSIALNLANYMTQTQNLSALTFSLEMTKEQCLERMYSSMAEIPLTDIYDGRVDSAGQRKLANIALAQNAVNMWIDDRGGLTVDQIEATISRHQNRHQVDLVIIDHLHIMKIAAGKQNKSDAIGEVCAQLKTIAKRYNVIMICLIQVNRESEKEKRDPRMSDALGGSGIEHNADVMMLLRNYGENEQHTHLDKVKACFVKTRDGCPGDAWLAFEKPIFKYRNAPTVSTFLPKA